MTEFQTHSLKSNTKQLLFHRLDLAINYIVKGWDYDGKGLEGKYLFITSLSKGIRGMKSIFCVWPCSVVWDLFISQYWKCCFRKWLKDPIGLKAVSHEVVTEIQDISIQCEDRHGNMTSGVWTHPTHFVASLSCYPLHYWPLTLK